MRSRSRVVLTLVFIAVIGTAAVLRLQLNYDLSAFLPPPTTAAQALLTQRLGQGPGAQLIFIELTPSSSDQAMAPVSYTHLTLPTMQ